MNLTVSIFSEKAKIIGSFLNMSALTLQKELFSENC